MRARHGNKRQPPFLLHRRLRPRLARREDAFVEPAEEHIRKLQPLSRMNGHELYLIALLGRIAVGKERHARQIIFEHCLFAAGRLVFVDGLLELSQIVEPLLTALGAQHGLIAARIE